MPKPYGPEFRRDVIEALQGGFTLDEAAAYFSLGRATVNRWSSRFNKTGRAEVMAPRHRDHLFQTNLIACSTAT